MTHIKKNCKQDKQVNRRYYLNAIQTDRYILYFQSLSWLNSSSESNLWSCSKNSSVLSSFLNRTVWKQKKGSRKWFWGWHVITLVVINSIEKGFWKAIARKYVYFVNCVHTYVYGSSEVIMHLIIFLQE